MTAPPDRIVTAAQLLLRSFDLQARAEMVLRALRDLLADSTFSGGDLARLERVQRRAIADISRAGLLHDVAMNLRRRTDPTTDQDAALQAFERALEGMDAVKNAVWYYGGEAVYEH